ncbi:MAG TPA: hypothetical protein IAB32_04960 [Candidatus Scatosoma pullicola]|nr:hypothetical protein [Candidatus Scatosoma pullicola]
MDPFDLKGIKIGDWVSSKKLSGYWSVVDIKENYFERQPNGYVLILKRGFNAKMNFLNGMDFCHVFWCEKVSPEKFAEIEKLFASNPVKKERFESYNGKIPPAVKGWFLTCDEEQKLLFEEQFKALGEYFTEKQFNRHAVKTGLRTHMKNSAKGAKYQLKIFGYSWVVDQNKNILWFNPVIEKIS